MALGDPRCLMATLDPFERLLDRCKADLGSRHGTFDYDANLDTAFRNVVADHFSARFGRGKKYGVYIVRQKSTKKTLYIGKGGTVDRGGRLKGQDIRGRLRNVRAIDFSANRWFREVAQRWGPLEVDYLILERPVAPAYVEAALLQAYLAEGGELPPENKHL